MFTYFQRILNLRHYSKDRYRRLLLFVFKFLTQIIKIIILKLLYLYF